MTSRSRQMLRVGRARAKLQHRTSVVGIALSELNCQFENRPDAHPRLSDLRESGVIEQDADQKWLLWRPNKGSTDQSDTLTRIDIAENRNGPTGLIHLDWHGPSSSFHNPASPVVEWR